MSKLTNFALAISCFLPVYIIFGVQNLCVAKCSYSAVEGQKMFQSVLGQSQVFKFNVVLVLIWLLLFVIGTCGVACFRKGFLRAKKLSKETVVLAKAENVTADYYFTYFSLFVISFFGVDPTKCKDVLIFAFLMALIIWVYVVNDMYFVNPVLNILGYKSFSISYYKQSVQDTADKKEPQVFEIKVFSTEPLNRMTGEKVFVTFSPHDFSVCSPIPKNSYK